ncbi:MAG: hypothetical protein J6K32_03280 [Clostridia bacterium]|nr:hypothetical protein [Clostridia bacterium]
MQSHARSGQARPLCPAPFSADFYAPYSAAAQTVLAAICRARQALVQASGEDLYALTYRLKTPSSISGKLLARGLPVTEAAAAAALHDVAGIRAVLGSVAQVYRFADLLESCLPLCDRRDYILEPKESGYRSLHLVFSIPAPDGGTRTPVEVQLRTAPMDIWASIEHQLVYKPWSDPAALPGAML